MATVSAFIDDSHVQSLAKDLRLLGRKRQFSDIIDGKGRQYVDLVMEGGGVLGVGLVGYTYALEQAGVRFLRVGGTSAGAINAILLAGLGTPSEEKSVKILKALAELNLEDLMDGNFWARGLINAALARSGTLVLLFWALTVIHQIQEYLGLNRGEIFLKWLTTVLEEGGVRSTADLRARMNAIPRDMKLRTGKRVGLKDADPYLALVAADVTTETKVDFPRMARLYWENAESVNPALFVRASMSIPFFFRPLKIEPIPRTPESRLSWEVLAGYSAEPPSACVFVDGGIMSNFPIALFHEPDTVPTAPTFGVKLGPSSRTKHAIKTPGNLAGAVFNSARHTLDYDFLTHHPDYNKLVGFVDTTGHNWLNFRLTDEAKLDLFRRGMEAAAGFLRKFDWKGYKLIRRKLAKQ
jgi:NTE family protein